MNPMLISGGLSLLGGMLGGQPSMPKGQQNLLRLQHRAAREMGEYARGVPGSDPQELAQMASMRGLLGQQQRGMMANMFSNLGASGSPAPMDLLSNLATQFQGQQSAAQANLFGQMLTNRRNALQQSAQMAAGAVPASQMTGGGGPDFGAILGNLAQGWAYQNALKQGAQLQQATPGTTNVGGGWVQTPYGSQVWQPGAAGGPGSAGSLTAFRPRTGPFGMF